MTLVRGKKIKQTWEIDLFTDQLDSAVLGDVCLVYPITMQGHWGTTDDFATTHFVLVQVNNRFVGILVFP